MQQLTRVSYRVSEFAAMAGYSKSFVHKEVAGGRIPAIRLGRSVRIPASWVEQFAQKQNPAGSGGKE
jgi:excisionase family DNA binding protein